MPKNKNKLLDRDGPFICSVECLLDWVSSHNYTPFNVIERYGNNGNGGYCTKAVSQNYNFRSVYEASVAELLLKHKISFKFEYLTFYWGPKQYTPDFYLPDHDCFLEVKGIWQPSTRTKYKSFRDTFDIDLIVAHWLLSKDVPKSYTVGKF
jgi:hypothetical protein